VIEKEDRIRTGRRELRDSGRTKISGGQRSGTPEGSNTRGYPQYNDYTLGFRPACTCSAQAIPCTVLDPFGGAGTTAFVAQNLGRRWISIELNPDYIELQKHRTAQQSMELAA
jgi:hypothetical protein